jgi:hypothetical protein
MSDKFEHPDVAALRRDSEVVGGDLSAALVETSARMKILIDPRIVESARRSEVRAAEFRRVPKPRSTLRKLGDGVLRLFG